MQPLTARARSELRQTEHPSDLLGRQSLLRRHQTPPPREKVDMLMTLSLSETRRGFFRKQCGEILTHPHLSSTRAALWWNYYFWNVANSS